MSIFPLSWTYDTTYQLTSEWRDGAHSYAITYTYDAAGNRLNQRVGGPRTTYSSDAANQLRRFQDGSGYTTYTYDGAGNLSLTRSPSNQRTTYTWDGESRLTQVRLPSATVNTFSYNGDGQRVKKQDSSGTVKFVWDGQNILAETNAGDVIQAVYSLEPIMYGNLISQRRASTTSFYHYDALGSTEGLSSATGGITDSYLYRAFGNLTVLSGSTPNRFQYVESSCYAYD
jgi:YD repeat-containing protein